MIGKTNAGSGGSGTGGMLTVTAPAGAAVTVSKGGKTKTRTADSSGAAVFKGLDGGTWTVSISGEGQMASKAVTIVTDYSVAIGFSTIPDFTYTGDFEIINDAGDPITTSQDNWQIRLLTSGTLTFKDLNGAADGIDIFLVGGGGGGSAVGSNPSNTSSLSISPGSAGGGSGYTKTYSGISVASNTAYSAAIGTGGAVHADGGQTSITIGAATYSADGGKCSTYNAHGGAGGSGGGAGGHGGASGSEGGAPGGVDGGNGTNGQYQNVTLASGGAGQGTTTRAFGEADGVLYATGGGAGGNYHKSAGTSYPQGAGGGNNPNTGDGGKGGGYKASGGAATAGGSGVIIIRNHRTA